MTPVVLVVLVAAWVGVVIFAFVKTGEADRAGRLPPALSRSRVPTRRDAMFWLHSNVNRGEYWPLWYWLLSLMLMTMIAAATSLIVDTWFAAGVLAIPALMIGYAIYRRLRYGFQGPPRRSSRAA